jgi:hypothetical protein
VKILLTEAENRCYYTCENYTLLRKLDLNLELRLRSLTEWALIKGKEL